MTNPLVPVTDYNAAYFELINRIDAIEKRLPVKRKRVRGKPTCSFQCPSEVYEQLHETATELAITRSKLLRQIVSNYLEGKNKPQGFVYKRVIDDDELIDL